MKITSAHVYAVDLPVTAEVPSIRVGPADGESKSFLDFVVKLETDAGITGYGEGSLFYNLQNQHLAAMKEILPRLIGKDPRETARINDIMDLICPFQSYAKSTIDIACWDILGKSSNVPLSTLLGGEAQDTAPVFVCMWPSDSKSRKKQIERAKAAGHNIIQVKTTGDPVETAQIIQETRKLLSDSDTLLIDPNTTMSIAGGLKLLEITDPKQQWCLEQPCLTMESCKRLRNETSRTLLLDENVENLHAVLKAHALDVGDVLIFKLGRLGGITKLKQARDLAVSLDKSIRIDGYASTDIEFAAVAHLAISTPAKNLFCTYDLAFHHDLHLADGGPEVKNGRLRAPRGPGLGVNVKEELLGVPVFSC